MCAFAASGVERGAYIDLQGRLAMAAPSQHYIQIAEWPPLPDFFEPDASPTLPNLCVKIRTYRIVRQAEDRYFYLGRNRRRRELPAKLEEVL